MITLPISSPTASFENSGGKGFNLARLTRLGIPVPPGFIIATDAYRRFVAHNRLDTFLQDVLSHQNLDDMEALEYASERIRKAFSAGKIPDEIITAVLFEYHTLTESSSGVAVRSSATTEDLPDLSFAGQQDTYLNIMGEDQLTKAVVDCWSSLWTARAIGYRSRNLISDEQAALAVVIQKMVPGETAGVMFTANPVSGLMNETVLDATFGLGEALVSGQVEPDHFVADSDSGLIKSFRPGSKLTSTRLKSDGGVESISEGLSEYQTLSQVQVSQLVMAGQQIQKAFGSPQDIEWAFAGGELSILQARPITSLFPVPRISFDPLYVWFALGAFQGIMGPVTPLGQESLQRGSLGMARKLHIPLNLEDQKVFESAGERIWVNMTDLIQNPLGNRLLGGFLGIGEQGSVSILGQLTSDPRFRAGKGRVRLRTLRRMLGFMLPGLKKVPEAFFKPEKARNRFDAQLEGYLKTVVIPGGESRSERLAGIAAFLENQGGIADGFPFMLVNFMPIMGLSMLMLYLIGHLLPNKMGSKRGITMPVMEVARGLPRNVTIEMDLLLWQVAMEIKKDAASASIFASEDAPELAAQFLKGVLPAAAQQAVSSFMDKYGMRGPGELDLGQPRWRENPIPILLTLQSYLKIREEDSPQSHHTQNVRSAEDAILRMSAEIRAQPGGWIKQKLFIAAVRRVRQLFGARESPKFYLVQTMGIIRAELLKVGKEYALDGTILRPDDLFFLHANELARISQSEALDWQGLIKGRRQVFNRELRRKQVPRILVSDGRAFFEGAGTQSENSNLITGSPVSPGCVEGFVHVVFDPREAQLAPGEIMVCPGTDPAWTPLFLAAGGLIMEVGGMMTHGSVVAREYGIPAVVGVSQATRRLKNGQRIRLDGTTGEIILLKDAALQPNYPDQMVRQNDDR